MQGEIPLAEPASENILDEVTAYLNPAGGDALAEERCAAGASGESASGRTPAGSRASVACSSGSGENRRVVPGPTFQHRLSCLHPRCHARPAGRPIARRPAAGRTAAGPQCRGAVPVRSGARPLAGYTIERGVGRGGFGEVYFARSDGGKEVALKLIRRNLDVELRGVRQCLNLKHPNLLAVYDVRADAEDNSWVVMEFMAGESLEEAIRRHPAGMPPAEALDWLRGIAAGVDYLHGHGIVHRDLKPANIFRDEGFVKLGDYGLSKFMSASRRSGQTDSVGTVHYMCPRSPTVVTAKKSTCMPWASFFTRCSPVACRSREKAWAKC